MQFSKLGDHISLIKGKKPASVVKGATSGYYPYVDIKAFETGVIENYTDGDKCVKCKDGDLLIVCDGSRSGLIGKAIDGYIGSTLARIDILNSSVDKDYLYYFLQSKYVILNKNVNLIVPYCSLEEQNEIIRIIEEKMTVCLDIEKTVNQSLQQAEALRQSILKQAFEED